MKTKITLIRHGQTEWNHKKRYQGHSDTRLNPTGKKQAREIRNNLKNEIFHKIYASDLKRAYEFAGIIFKGKTIHKKKRTERA